MIVTRPATTLDADAIATIHIAAWRAAYRGMVPDQLLAALDHSLRAALWADILGRDRPRSRVMAAESAGEFWGFGDLRPSLDGDRDPSRVGEVAALYVDPAHWRGGAGGALLDALESAAIEFGYETLELRVLEQNDPARRFYERLGWETDGVLLPDRAGVSQHGFPDGVPVEVVRYSRVVSAL